MARMKLQRPHLDVFPESLTFPVAGDVAGSVMRNDGFCLMGLQIVTLIKMHRFNYRANVC